ncbi:hypothetical protein PRUPE_2G057200 [Prunus persica]|uniref:Uncharacterized protein n=1 Tax=Prunus persica TaxID=3760 RepID=A0A251QF30_PRUPE|nr:hypothetical protein PRUPE_2G057200 [Prunus persica]
MICFQTNLTWFSLRVRWNCRSKTTSSSDMTLFLTNSTNKHRRTITVSKRLMRLTKNTLSTITKLRRRIGELLRRIRIRLILGIKA